MHNRSEDRLADFTRDSRVLVLSLMAVVVGVMSALVAAALVWLINVITDIAFYQKISSEFLSPAGHHLGYLVVLVPALGGLIIGLMARFGSDKIRGHGIPEALEAILYGRSRIEPKVAVLKPLSSAISIGTGGPFGAEGPIIMTGGASGFLCSPSSSTSPPPSGRRCLWPGRRGACRPFSRTPVAAVLLAVELAPVRMEAAQFHPRRASPSVVARLAPRPPAGRRARYSPWRPTVLPDMRIMAAASRRRHRCWLRAPGC